MLPENVVRCLSFDGLILFVVPPLLLPEGIP